jgi:flagellar motor protein MotB
VAGAKDHPLVSRYAGSDILGYETRDFASLALVLSPQTSDPASGAPVVAQGMRVEGKLTRILYASPAERSSLEVARNYQEALTQAGFQVLFQCGQEQCGQRLAAYLYPLERKLKNSGQIGEYALEFPRDQQFICAKLGRPQGDVYLMVYTAVCGINNFKETYNHPITLLEIIETKPMATAMVKVDALAMAKDIAAKGSVAVYGIYFDHDKAEVKPESGEALAEIAKLLQAQPALKVYLVGHTDNVGALPYNLQLSQQRAEAVVKALASRHGIAAARLTPKGVGPLAPVASNQAEEGRAKNRRVELVAQ